MAFNFTPSKPSETLRTLPSGATPFAWHMLGAAGATTTGVSKWIDVTGAQWKSFLLRRAASPFNDTVGTASIEIQACNELDDVDADANSKFVVLGTLNAGAPSLTLEDPWRFVRAEVKTAGGGGEALQVDCHGILA